MYGHFSDRGFGLICVLDFVSSAFKLSRLFRFVLVKDRYKHRTNREHFKGDLFCHAMPCFVTWLSTCAAIRVKESSRKRPSLASIPVLYSWQSWTPCFRCLNFEPKTSNSRDIVLSFFLTYKSSNQTPASSSISVKIPNKAMFLFVWLPNLPATCLYVSGTDKLRQT